ncbi:T9SS type A sorting domain-containing protein [candidate division WOR-3 bacterium]|nr:T9SS type A sorting domain-containing protein [candidate division WOR-3 bacterium]
MKRLFAFVFLPVVLFALEPVNLIKDGGFEKDSELWLERSKIYGAGGFDSTVYNRHDPDSAYIGSYCASIDGRKRPAQNLPFNYGIMGQFYQPLAYPKKLKDLDSLELFHMVLFREEGVKGSTWAYGTRLYFTRSSDGILIDVVYDWAAPDLTPAPDNPSYKHFPNTIANEGVWYSLKRDLKVDLIGEKDLSEDIELDTFLLFGTSWLDRGTWRGQKAFFDGVRLMGYADYDVGVKEILSGDSLREDTPYIPQARIKNFGRENAPEFYVIAEVWDEETQIYYDSLPWSLDSDTEDIASFAEFTPDHPAPYILTIRTVMEPDESDEDDQLSKPLIYVGIAEPVTHPDAITLEVRSLTAPLRVSYSLPYTESGTLTLYDAAGRRVERANIRGGSGKVEFNSALPSGVYFVRLESADLTITKKAVVLR